MYKRWSINREILAQRWEDFQQSHINPHMENVNRDYEKLFGIQEQNMNWDQIQDEIYYRDNKLILTAQSEEFEFSLDSNAFDFKALQLDTNTTNNSLKYYEKLTGQKQDIIDDYVQNDIIDDQSEVQQNIFQNLLEVDNMSNTNSVKKFTHNNLQSQTKVNFDSKYQERIKLRSPQKPEKIQEKELITNIDKDKSRKMKLFNTIINFEYIGASLDIYQDSQWIQNYYHFNKSDDNFYIALGDTFTVFLNQNKLNNAYSFGDNSFGQLVNEFDMDKNQSIYNMKSINNIRIKNKYVKSVNNFAHGFLLDNEGKVYGYGQNNNGQLGTNNNKEVGQTLILNEFLENIVDIDSKNHINIAINNSGKVLVWPFQKEKNKFILKPVELPVAGEITQVSCGWEFSCLLSRGGQVWVFGKASDKGQLGQGDFKARQIPVLVPINEKIDSVSCGYAHTVCKSARGKIYSWGDNSLAQVTYSQQLFFNRPHQLQILSTQHQQYIHCYQVRAGFNSNICLMSNGKVFVWGHTKMTGLIKQPQQFNQFTNQENYNVIQVRATWSRTLSILYAVVADCRMVKENTNLIQKVCANLSQQWIQNNLEPPVLDSFLKYFSINTMTKLVVDATEIISPNKQKQVDPLSEDQIQFLIKKFGLDDTNQKNLLSFTDATKLKGLQDTKQNNQKQQLLKIKRLAMSLINIPQQKLNQLDKQLIKIVQDNLVFSLLKRL